MERHYVKYLLIVLAFLFLFLGSYRIASNSLAVQLAPGVDGTVNVASAGNALLNFYVNITPAISGVLIVGALGLMILIVVESRRGV